MTETERKPKLSIQISANTSRLGFCAGIVALTLCASGCDPDTASDDEHASNDNEVLDPVAEGLMQADYLGDEIGVARPRFIDRGPTEVDWSGQANHPAIEEGDDSGFKHIPETELEVFDFTTEHRYSVSLPAGFERVGEVRAQRMRELPLPELVGDDVLDRLNPKRILGGTDTRIKMGIAQGFGASDWLSAIGLLDQEGCTGTLLSHGAYVTAAHCMFNTAGAVVKRDFYPRADESQGFIDLPWGAWDATQVVVPAAYTNNSCNTNFTVNCIQYDIALVRVTADPLFPGHTYTFEPLAETRPTLLTRALKNRGYPLLGAVDAPAGIANSWTLYGDGNNCALGADVYPSDPYSAVINHTCDTSEGHSGSPLFYYVASGRPKIIGVHSSSDAATPATWNRFKRFSPNTLTWLNGLL